MVGMLLHIDGSKHLCPLTGIPNCRRHGNVIVADHTNIDGVLTVVGG